MRLPHPPPCDHVALSPWLLLQTTCYDAQPTHVVDALHGCASVLTLAFVTALIVMPDSPAQVREEVFAADLRAIPRRLLGLPFDGYHGRAVLTRRLVGHAPRALERALLPSSCLTHTISVMQRAGNTCSRCAFADALNCTESMFKVFGMLGNSASGGGMHAGGPVGGVKTSLCAARAHRMHQSGPPGQRRSSTVAPRSARFTCGDDECHRVSGPTRFEAPRRAVLRAPMRCRSVCRVRVVYVIS